MALIAMIAGLLSLIFGILILIFPRIMNQLVGVWLVLFGVLALTTSVGNFLWW